MINMIKLKKKYNEVLKREKKASLYIDAPEGNINKIMNVYIPEYQKIVQQLSIMLLVIGTFTQEEALEGFKIEEVN